MERDRLDTAIVVKERIRHPLRRKSVLPERFRPTSQEVFRVSEMMKKPMGRETE